MRNALVAGAGVAGLTAARALISRGVPVLLVEQRPTVGGWAATYGCKAGADCTLCGVCLAAATSCAWSACASVVVPAIWPCVK